MKCARYLRSVSIIAVVAVAEIGQHFGAETIKSATPRICAVDDDQGQQGDSYLHGGETDSGAGCGCGCGRGCASGGSSSAQVSFHQLNGERREPSLCHHEHKQNLSYLPPPPPCSLQHLRPTHLPARSTYCTQPMPFSRIGPNSTPNGFLSLCLPTPCVCWSYLCTVGAYHSQR